MNRLVLLVSGLLLAMLILAAACVSQTPPPETKVVSSCITCHSDKDLLKQTAAPVKEVKSEATSGEG